MNTETNPRRANVGRVLCFGLGLLYAAGAVPLFNFGQVGTDVWSVVEAQVTAIATAIGVWPWLLMWFLGPLIIGGPLALVWLIAGPGVRRIQWFLGGLIAYGLWWAFGPRLF